MKIAVDTHPLKSGHKVRGVGAYTQNLINQFRKGQWDVDFEFFENPASPPPADVIHHPYFDLFFHTLSIRKKNNRVVTIHDVIPLVFPKYFPAGVRGYFNLFFQKMALKNVDAIICDSQSSKKDIEDKLSVPKEKIHVIYLAAAENFKKINSKIELDKISKKYNLPGKFILYVGDVNWNKNIPNLLIATKIAKTNLVMVGEALANRDLQETKELNNLIKRLGIEDKIIKTGFVEEMDLIALYNLAALTILPSYYEGFGLPILESMSCGTLVVCSKIASLPEIAQELGIYCDPEDPRDIAQKIQKTMNLSAREKHSLSQKYQDHVKKFTWEKVARQTIDVYKTSINK